jgi:Icc-related predicted phosphoesterase
MRVFAVSDIHTDFKKNWDLIANLSDSDFQQDVLILAGDVADRLITIRNTLSLVRSKFNRVFYVPGNHELWVRGEPCDSLEKFSRIVEQCDALEVETRPAKLAGLWVVPLLSWYEASFDVEPNGDDADLDSWGDFRFCKWPEEIGALSEYFARINEPDIRCYDGPVISFSHFLPRPELLPPKKNLRFRGLPRVAGSTSLEDQIRRLRSAVHVFGHSHINYDCVIDGVRYVQNALAYPNERWYPRDAIKQIWESDGPARRIEPAFGMAAL